MQPPKKQHKEFSAAVQHENLLKKSRIYMERAFTAKDSGDEEVFKIWASLSLEVLGKSFLSKINPALVIDTKETSSIMAALGFDEEKKIRTIGARETFLRIQKIHHTFNQDLVKFCCESAEQRNTELHSGDQAFLSTEKEWEDKFFHASSRILSGFKSSVSYWLTHTPTFERMNIRIDNVRNAEISIAKSEVEEKRNEWKRKSKKEKEEAKNIGDDFYFKHFDKYTRGIGGNIFEKDANVYRKCPACEDEGFLVGTDPQKTIKDRTQDGDWLVAEIIEEYSAFTFHCPYCLLTIEEDYAIEAVGIDSSFTYTNKENRDLREEPLGTRDEDYRRC